MDEVDQDFGEKGLGGVLKTGPPSVSERTYLKPETIFLRRFGGISREYCVLQFSDALGQRYEAQFVLPEGDYHKTFEKLLRRMTGVNPFKRVGNVEAERKQEQEAATLPGSQPGESATQGA